VPLYEYKCLKCGRVTERIENVSGPFLKKCPHCGGKVESLISASSIQFKGSGWYVTDYAGKKSGSSPSGSEKSSGDGSDSKDKKETKDSKSEGTKDSSAKETPAKEKKSEKKK
jgi:putative FmdB family regulatory protein